MKNFLRLLEMVKSYAGWVALSVLLGCATTISSIGLLGSSSYLITMAALQPSIAVLQVAIVGVRFFGIARGVFRYLERLASHDVTFRLLADLRVMFYQGIERIIPARNRNFQSGDLQSRATADIDVLQNFYVRVIAPPLTALIISLGVGWFAGSYAPVMGAIIGGGMLISGTGISLLAYHVSKKAQAGIQDARGLLNARVVSLIQGSQELVSLQAEERFLKLTNEQSREYCRRQLRFNRISALVNGLNTFAMNILLWLVLLVGIPLVGGREITSIELAVLSMIALASYEVITPLGQAAQHLENSLKAAKRLFRIADAEPEIAENKEQHPMPMKPDLRLDHISFTYQDEDILTDFSLEIPFKKRIAIVGPSGAGKSTLLRILARFYEVHQGDYLINGFSAKEYSHSDIRQSMAILDAKPYIFQKTIRENLKLANGETSDQEIVHALEQVNLLPWLNQQKGDLDSLMGEQGKQMSGGELQRFGLARCILRNSAIWLLDEPTANLDAVLEHQMLSLLEKATREKTVVWITHHITGLDFMDEIIFLEKGKIVERGKEKDLLVRQGRYAGWVRLQATRDWEMEILD
jgi:ATP-binding cassette subfamily C protein CydC